MFARVSIAEETHHDEDEKTTSSRDSAGVITCRSMDRRKFLAASAAGAVGLAAGALAALRPRAAPRDLKYGESRIGITETDRDGTLYVPKSYKPGTPMPVMMMLHGFMGSGDGFARHVPAAEEFGVMMIAPESRGMTWGRSIPGFDADVRYLGPAYRRVANLVDIDTDARGTRRRLRRRRLRAVDGPGLRQHFQSHDHAHRRPDDPFRQQGKPRMFFAHGVDDMQIPIDETARKYRAAAEGRRLRRHVSRVSGGHRVPPTEIREAFKWFVGRDPKGH